MLKTHLKNTQNFEGTGVFFELGRFDKQSSTTANQQNKKKVPGKKCPIFLLEILKN